MQNTVGEEIVGSEEPKEGDWGLLMPSLGVGLEDPLARSLHRLSKAAALQPWLSGWRWRPRRLTLAALCSGTWSAVLSIGVCLAVLGIDPASRLTIMGFQNYVRAGYDDTTIKGVFVIK